MKNGKPKVKNMRSKLKRSEHPSYLESMAGSFYKQIDPRLKQQVMDSRMMQEDEYAIANLSPRVINKMFNPSRYMESLGRRFEDSEVGE